MIDTKSPDKIKHRKLMRKSTYIILAGVLILGSLTVLIVAQAPSYEDAMKSAPKIISENLLSNLTVFRKKDHDYLPFKGVLAIGDELSFNVSVLRPTFVGLLVSVNQGKPAFAFYGRLPPGENHRLERQGNRYLYKIANLDDKVRICVVSAKDKQALQKLNHKIMKLWSNIPPSACVSIP